MMEFNDENFKDDENDEISLFKKENIPNLDK